MAALALLATVVTVAVVTAVGASGAATPPQHPAPTHDVEKVLIISVPGLEWSLVHQEQPPALTGLLGRSAVGSLSVRTVGPRTSLAEGYATAGAGSRAAGGPEGVLVAPSQVSPPAVADLSQIQEANRALAFGAEPGALGKVLVESGRRGAVVANADLLTGDGELLPHREAALALMDGQGRVHAGTVGPELTTEDPSVAGGLRADPEATLAAFSAAWSSADVVLLEASDLARVGLAGEVADLVSLDEPGGDGPGLAGDDARRRALSRALSRADAVLGAALDQVDLDRHLVVVMAPVSGRAGRDGLVVGAVAGPGVAPGLATSATTRRPGIVTLTDVAPTVLGALGLGVPASMVGSPVRSGGEGQPGGAQFESLAVAGEVSSFRDDATGPVSVVFVAFQVLTYALAGAALAWWPRLAPVVAFLALVALALPSLTFLSGLVRYDRLGVVGYVVALLLGSAVAAGASLGLARAAARTGPARALVAPLALVGLTLAVLVGDILVGGPLQLDTVFGYSPIVAGRFTGYGNLAFALLGASALVAVTGVWAAFALIQGRAAPRPRPAWLVGMAVVLSLVVVADGHPDLGADVGGVLALVPAAIVAVAVVAGVRMRPGVIIAAGAAALAVAAGFAAADLARPPGRRTHVGRFAAQVLDGGGGVAMVIERKINANLSLLFSSVWTLVIPVALVVLVVLVRRRGGVLGRLEAGVPGLRACLVAALVLAVLGGALNDSGVAVPAMVLAVLLPYLTVLAMRFQAPAPRTDEPVEAAMSRP